MFLSLEEVTLSNRLSGITAAVDSGCFVHLLGPNGSGKSSLLLAISGLVVLNAGNVKLNDKQIDNYDLVQLSQFRVLLEQSEQLNFPLTVKESLSFSQDMSELPEALETALEVNVFLSRTMNTLSGGEQQRVNIMRILMQIWPALQNGEGLVLLDEPFRGLDFKHQHLLCQLLKKLARQGNLVIVSQHDLNLCEQYADSVWLLQNGELRADGDTQSVLDVERLEGVFDCQIKMTVDRDEQRYFSTALP
jgi:ABC-type hemin transport system ATPase subunit